MLVSCYSIRLVSSSSVLALLCVPFLALPPLPPSASPLSRTTSSSSSSSSSPSPQISRLSISTSRIAILTPSNRLTTSATPCFTFWKYASDSVRLRSAASKSASVSFFDGVYLSPGRCGPLVVAVAVEADAEVLASPLPASLVVPSLVVFDGEVVVCPAAVFVSVLLVSVLSLLALPSLPAPCPVVPLSSSDSSALPPLGPHALASSTCARRRSSSAEAWLGPNTCEGPEALSSMSERVDWRAAQ